jgi:hypothetical protein
VFPTRRRVYLHDENGIADESSFGITLDIDTIHLEEQS